MLIAFPPPPLSLILFLRCAAAAINKRSAQHFDFRDDVLLSSNATLLQSIANLTRQAFAKKGRKIARTKLELIYIF